MMGSQSQQWFTVISPDDPLYNKSVHTPRNNHRSVNWCLGWPFSEYIQIPNRWFSTSMVSQEVHLRVLGKGIILETCQTMSDSHSVILWTFIFVAMSSRTMSGSWRFSDVWLKLLITVYCVPDLSLHACVVMQKTRAWFQVPRPNLISWLFGVTGGVNHDPGTKLYWNFSFETLPLGVSSAPFRRSGTLFSAATPRDQLHHLIDAQPLGRLRLKLDILWFSVIISRQLILIPIMKSESPHPLRQRAKDWNPLQMDLPGWEMCRCPTLLCFIPLFVCSIFLQERRGPPHGGGEQASGGAGDISASGE